MHLPHCILSTRKELCFSFLDWNDFTFLYSLSQSFSFLEGSLDHHIDAVVPMAVWLTGMLHLQSERKFNSRLYDLKDRLEQCHSTNRSMQNYVQFLKNSYANVFGETSTFGNSSYKPPIPWPAVSLNQPPTENLSAVKFRWWWWPYRYCNGSRDATEFSGRSGYMEGNKVSTLLCY